MLEKIYILSVVEPEKIPKAEAIGWFPNLESAKKAVKGNLGHFSSCRFYYCVIEESYPRAYSLSKEKFWYKFTPKGDFDGKWKKIKRPGWAKGVCNWWN